MDPKELSFEESMQQVMKTLPPVIRDYLVKEKYTPVARSLMTKYGLRIDQGGVLEREIMLLLMGVENPTEFTEALAEEAKLTKIVIDGIVQDVNNQIFVPLRKEEEKGSMIATEVRPSPEFPKVEPQRPVPVPTPPASASQPASHFNLQNKIPVPQPISPAPKKDWSNLPPAPMKGTLPPKVFLPRPAEALSVGGPRPATLGEVVRSVLAVPKPIENSKLLEDHEEPHIEINKILVPQNLPGAMPPQAIPEVLIPEVRPSPEILKVEPQIQPLPPKPPFVAPVESKPVPLPAAPTLLASYASDPYREPVDEPIDEM